MEMMEYGVTFDNSDKKSKDLPTQNERRADFHRPTDKLGRIYEMGKGLYRILKKQKQVQY